MSLKDFIIEYAKSKGYDYVDKGLLWECFEVKAKVVDQSDPDEHRWYTAYNVVYEIDVAGTLRYFSYWVVSVKSESMDWSDCGWETPDLDDLTELYPKEVTTTIYVTKDEL